MKRSDNIGWAQVKAGIFILVALGFLAGGVLFMEQKTKLFVPKGKLSIIMTDVAGLKVGAPVWLAGVDVGIVTDVQFDKPKQNNEVEIVLEVERESLKKIGKDSVITIKTRGLMGEKYVDITPSRYVAEVPPTRLYGTQMARLDDVMQKAGSTFDRMNLIIDKVNRGEGTLGKFSNDPKLYDNMVRLVTELNTFATSVNYGEGTLGKLNRSSEPYDRLMAILTHADATIQEIQGSEGTLGKLVHDRQLYDKLVALADKSVQAAEDVRELNRKLTSKESTIGRLLGEREMYDKGMALIERADNSIKTFELTISKLNQPEGTAGKLINERVLYERMNKMVDDLDLLVKDIKENPKRYLKFSLF